MEDRMLIAPLLHKSSLQHCLAVLFHKAFPPTPPERWLTLCKFPEGTIHKNIQCLQRSTDSNGWYLIVHVVEVQWLAKGCFHFLLHVLIAHRTDKWDNSGMKENR